MRIFRTSLLLQNQKSSVGVFTMSDYSRAGQIYTQTHSSLLQSVIRNLVDSADDDEERQTQRSKLENDLEISSERIDTLVREHKDKLHGTLDTFEKMDSRIRDSQDKIRELRGSLQSSKILLRCKREELKRLWVEDVKYKHMLKMIGTIEAVRGVPEQLKRYRQSKHYLHATELLVNNVAKVEGELSSVEALKDLKQELKLQKETFHQELIDELHKHLYVKPTAKKDQQLQSQTSPESMVQGTSPGPARRANTAVTVRQSRSATRTMAMEKEASAAVLLHPTIKEEDDQITEDVGIDPEENSSHYMALLIESLSTLGKVGDALEAIQNRMQREFLLIIERASIQVTRTADQEDGIVGGMKVTRANNPKLLHKLLQMCFKRFRSVVSAHSVLLGHLQRAKKVYRKANYQLYEEKDVWAAIQHVLQEVLEMYLAFDEESSNHGGVGVTTFTGTSDIHALFAPKKKSQSKAAKKSLFRFDSSRHAISISSYMREQRDNELAEGVEGAGSATRGNQPFGEDQPSISQHLVCKPSARNITVVFGAVRGFVLEIEEALKMPMDDHCRLYHFLHDFVEQQFIDSISSECAEKLNTSTKSEAAKATANDQKTARVVGTKQCVLNSVIVVWQLVEELRGLMRDLPMYSTHFLSILCEMLKGYRDSCYFMYKELTVASVDGAKGMTQEVIVSSKWAKDEDINRMIRSLPNWMMLRQSSRSKVVEEEGGGAGKRDALYAKESDTLTTNLGGELLKKGSVVLFHDNLRLLAILHESLDWFSSRLKQKVMELTNQGAGTMSPTPPSVRVMTDGAALSSGGGDVIEEETIEQERQTLDLMEQFSKIQFDFQSLAETTIIMLHLEVRCHCFYFLQPIVQRSHSVSDSDSTEAEPQAKLLATDLKNIENAMVAVLSPEKYRYLFEGLGHLVAAIFITSTHHMKSISQNGIKRMCRNITVLQSCLTKITLIREKDLDKARQYFEMLYMSDEDLFHMIHEQGPMYSQKDYTNAIVLLSHSRQDFDEWKLKTRLQELDEVFSKDSV